MVISSMCLNKIDFTMLMPEMLSTCLDVIFIILDAKVFSCRWYWSKELSFWPIEADCRIIPLFIYIFESISSRSSLTSSSKSDSEDWNSRWFYSSFLRFFLFSTETPTWRNGNSSRNLWSFVSWEFLNYWSNLNWSWCSSCCYWTESVDKNFSFLIGFDMAIWAKYPTVLLYFLFG